MKSAESILIANDGTILFNNFGEEKTTYFMAYFHQIYRSVEMLREMDSMEVA